MSKQDAQVALKGTTSGDKNELLFSRFSTNYNEIPQRFRKGTTLFRARPTAVVVQPPPGPSQESSPEDEAAVTTIGENSGCVAPVEECVPPQDGAGEETTGQQSRESDEQTPNHVEVEFIRGSCPPVDGNPESGSPRATAQAGVVTRIPAAREEHGGKLSEISGKGKDAHDSKTADGKRSKRLLKKGHAPPGAIEEDACDLIRNDFWDRNPQILAGVARRR